MTRGVLFVVCVLSTIAGTAHGQTNTHEAIFHLTSPVVSERRDAAEHLREARNINVVRPLLEAAKVETDHNALGTMLRALGESGMMEALGLIQTHARSPVEDIRDAARAALRDWLVTNLVLEEGEPLPDPPHPFYEAPPTFPPDRAAGRPIEVWAGQQPFGTPPEYVPTMAGGVPPGMRVGSEPKWGLFGAGIGVFLGLYVPTSISAVATGAFEMVVPVAGPVILSAVLFDQDLGILAVPLLINAGGQLAGLSMMAAGLGMQNPVLEKDMVTVDVEITPGGLALSGRF